MKVIKLLTIYLVIFITGCSRSPQPINYGSDNCENCLMTITDPRYGSELITDKGKIYKFDSIECLAAYSEKLNSDEIASMWVTDFGGNTKFVNTQNAFFVKSENLRSPMGLNLTAFSSDRDLMKTIDQYGGKSLTWNELTQYVQVSWSE